MLPRHKGVRKALALALGIAAGLLIAEGALRILGLPRFYKAHRSSPQFAIRSNQTGQIELNEYGRIFYVNSLASAITFRYDSNPRGYFKPGNIVVHQTNREGFRGPDYAPAKPARTIRLAFLGDSFTFGEGVHFDDTFAEVTCKLLARHFADKHLAFQGGNFGVAGYNTDDELYLLKTIVPKFHPDAVVLCYHLNDAEPPMFVADAQGRVFRGFREKAIPEGVDEPTPPDCCLYRLHVAQLAWQFIAQRQRSRQTEAYYRALYQEQAGGWKAARQALAQIVQFCRQEKLPLVVMLFPVLYRLDDSHPFLDLYAAVAQAAESNGARVLNLFPAFRGQSAAALWVYPTDQHPNQIAHRIAAEQLAKNLAVYNEFLSAVNAAAAGLP